MSVDDELTRAEQRSARVAVEVAESPRWMHAALPGLLLTSAALQVWFAWRRVTTDPLGAFWAAATAGAMGGSSLVLLADYRLQRALGVLYRRATTQTGHAEDGGSGAPPGELSRARIARLDPGPLRSACLVAFASGLAVCGVALWRFGSGEATPPWAGIAMGSAGGLGAGAALVASFLPRWMSRVTRLEARSERDFGP